MNKVFVLDTNIWISYIINRNFHGLANLIVENKITVLCCIQMEKEIREVLQRPKFKKYIPKESIPEIAAIIRKLCFFIPVVTIKSYTSDPDDDYLFELAIKGKADFLVSGDKQILSCKSVQGVKMLNLTEFKAFIL